MKKLLKLSLFIIIILIITFFVVRNYFPKLNIISSEVSYTEPIPIPPAISQSLQNLIDTQSKNNIVTKQSNSNLPIRLKIPVINVDATIEYLGITSDGSMDVPKGPDNVAWFNLGTIPGEIGSAVMAGHYGWKNNIPAVFDDLSKLKIGDEIKVVNDNNTTNTFIVRKIGIYGQNADATEVFSSTDGIAHLNLITCEGVWNVVSKSRPSRLVVFADKK